MAGDLYADDNGAHTIQNVLKSQPRGQLAS